MQSTDCRKGPRGPIGSWDIYGVTDMRNLFVEKENTAEKNTDGEKDSDTGHRVSPIPGAGKFNGDLSKWDVLDVIEMQSMFQYASSFNADLSKWDVSRVKNMGGMFGKASTFNADLSKWDVSSATDMRQMFSGAKSFKGNLYGAWFTSTADKKEMFEDSFGQIYRKILTDRSPSRPRDLILPNLFIVYGSYLFYYPLLFLLALC